jgi:hypothetical protein
VRGPRLGAAEAQVAELVLDQAGLVVGHPAQQHELEVDPPEPAGVARGPHQMAGRSSQRRWPAWTAIRVPVSMLSRRSSAT